MPALTGLRAFTATNIVFFHFWNPAWFGPLAPMMDNGYVGVNFFFLLSGFILAYNYSDRSDAGQFDRKQFWQTRFSRLYPVYVLGLLISIPILELEWKHRTHGQFFLGLGLTSVMQQGWSPRLCTFWNTPAWTLSCETVFYLLFPLLVAIKWPRQTRKLLLILAGCWLASLVIPVVYMSGWIGPDHPHVQQLLAASGENDAAAASAHVYRRHRALQTERPDAVGQSHPLLVGDHRARHCIHGVDAGPENAISADA
jgi:peptidoglycan/LPS O-acetylase OafA/YrhL